MSVHGACRIFFALIERRERKRRRGSDLNLWLVHKDLSSAIQAKRLDYSLGDTVRLETQGDEFVVNRDSGLGGSSSETAQSGLRENARKIDDAGEFVSSCSTCGFGRKPTLAMPRLFLSPPACAMK